jgi:putative NIF3 family GTP cyclohydrolase 1 type 2
MLGGLIRVPLVVKRGGVLGHYGAGRIVEFENPTTMSTLVNRVKSGLNLDYVQVAFGGSKCNE